MVVALAGVADASDAALEAFDAALEAFEAFEAALEAFDAVLETSDAFGAALETAGSTLSIVAAGEAPDAMLERSDAFGAALETGSRTADDETSEDADEASEAAEETSEAALDAGFKMLSPVVTAVVIAPPSITEVKTLPFDRVVVIVPANLDLSASVTVILPFSSTETVLTGLPVASFFIPPVI